MAETKLADTPDGRRIEVAAAVDAPPAAAWDLLIDTHRWPEWGPSVRAVECEDRWIRFGSTGRVVLPGGVRVPFAVDGFDPEVRRWTWRVARIPATGHRVDDLGSGCRVVFELPVLAAGYAPVCHLALRRIRNLLEG
ncbi:polyketide cyclase [Halobacteriales archaeon QS_8_69_26]|nr:MAG: polyketide cyclase [Halobacteriales archaeon QS_8_69_26]